MALRERKRVVLRGTNISYDVIAGQIEPVEVFVDNVAVSRLSPVDAHVATITLVAKLREMAQRQAARAATATTRPMTEEELASFDKANSLFDEGFDKFDKGFGALGRVFSRKGKR